MVSRLLFWFYPDVADFRALFFSFPPLHSRSCPRSRLRSCPRSRFCPGSRLGCFTRFRSRSRPRPRVVFLLVSAPVSVPTLTVYPSPSPSPCPTPFRSPLASSRLSDLVLSSVQQACTGTDPWYNERSFWVPASVLYLPVCRVDVMMSPTE